MCLDFPHKITKISGDQAEVFCSKTKDKEKIKVNLVKGLKIGDYVLSQNGYAVTKLSKKEAEETFKLLKWRRRIKN